MLLSPMGNQKTGYFISNVSTCIWIYRFTRFKSKTMKMVASLFIMYIFVRNYRMLIMYACRIGKVQWNRSEKRSMTTQMKIRQQSILIEVSIMKRKKRKERRTNKRKSKIKMQKRFRMFWRRSRNEYLILVALFQTTKLKIIN